MAERLKTQLLEKEKAVDLVAGPDAYRDLPALITAARGGEEAVNVMLSVDETYSDIAPVRTGDSQVKFCAVISCFILKIIPPLPLFLFGWKDCCLCKHHTWVQ